MDLPEKPEIRPADLRGILRYVPQWRGHCFVISIDAGVLQDDNYSNLLLDLAVLHNLHIKVVVVFGIGRRIEAIGEERGLTLSDTRGEGPTDELTLRVSAEAAGTMAQELLQGLTQTGLNCVIANPIRATEVGILNGVDQIHSGKVDKVDALLLRKLIESELVPIIAPVASGRNGQLLRLNSDIVGAEIAMAMGASKLIYLAPHEGLTIKGQMHVNVPVQQVRNILDESPADIDEIVRLKAVWAARTVENGVPRAHIIDGRLREGLLTEIFSKVGIGTMIYANEYTQVRPARRRDLNAIYNITQNAVRDQSLRRRDRTELERHINHFFVFEIDQSIIGCSSLKPYADPSVAELEAVYVQPFYQGRGVGRKLVDYAIAQGRRKGLKRLVALSTQSISFFKSCGFKEGTKNDLPPERAKELEESGRNSRVLVIEL